MENFVKIFPSEINGEVTITGAKNSVLRQLAASILIDESVQISNYPSKMLDVVVHEEMLSQLGKQLVRTKDGVIIDGRINTSNLIWNKRSIRNTLLILGALLTKTGAGKVPLPGGCPLGDRKYDIHIGLMKAMGADVWQEDNYLCAKVEGRLKGCEFSLPIRSTGATENSLIMASLAHGKTRIWNPHIRPEILDLIGFLRKMGAKIEVRGQESIIIEGVDKLHGGFNHFCISDNMQALTYLVAGAIAG